MLDKLLFKKYIYFIGSLIKVALVHPGESPSCLSGVFMKGAPFWWGSFEILHNNQLINNLINLQDFFNS